MKKEKLETPKDMFLFRQKAIQVALKDKDISIRASWSLNCAVAEIAATQLADFDEGNLLQTARKYLALFQRIKDDLVNEKARQLEIEEQNMENEVQADFDNLPTAEKREIIKKM